MHIKTHADYADTQISADAFTIESKIAAVGMMWEVCVARKQPLRDVGQQMVAGHRGAVIYVTRRRGLFLGGFRLGCLAGSLGLGLFCLLGFFLGGLLWGFGGGFLA